jgi:Triose-phosphate Transporter family
MSSDETIIDDTFETEISQAEMFSIFTTKVSKTEDSDPLLSNDGVSSSKPHGLDRAIAAIFYGITSLAVIFTNKSIMTGYNFPFFDFLAAVQFIATIVILSVLVIVRKVEIPVLSYTIFREVFPISMMFLGNVICGLGSTRSLNLPMFTALRRFSILMTMMAEYFILNNLPSKAIIISVFLMVGGALVAAAYDLTFNAWGYALVFLNNGFTTLNGVYLKKASMSGKCNKMGILFYNSLFSAVAMLLFFGIEHYNVALDNRRLVSNSFRRDIGVVPVIPARLLAESNTNTTLHNIFPATLQHEGAVWVNSSGEILQSTLTKIFYYDGWAKPDFMFIFICAALLGSVLNYSIFVCTTINSALTTAVVGCLKNVVTTYIGMMIFTDYSFSLWNFLGINISIIGSLYYTYYTMYQGGK